MKMKESEEGEQGGPIRNDPVERFGGFLGGNNSRSIGGLPLIEELSVPSPLLPATMEYLNTVTSYMPAVETVQFGLIGTAFLANPLHGGVSGAMSAIGYPSAFFPVTGAWMLSIAAANYLGQIPLAQGLLATLMGGAIWHHAVGEGAPAHAGGSVMFLGLAIATAAKNGVPLPQAVGGGLGLAALGWGIGAMLPREVAKAAAKKAAKAK